MKTKRRSAIHSPETILKYSRTAEPPYHCKRCNFTADNFAAVAMHYNRSHNGKVRPPGTGNGVRKSARRADSKATHALLVPELFTARELQRLRRDLRVLAKRIQYAVNHL